MKELLQNYNLLFAMTILTAVAILIKCICAIIYQILIRETDQITATKNKWLRAMITKYEACYKLHIPIHNPECFIKHYFSQYRFLGISIITLENTDLFAGLMVTCATLFSILGGIYYELPPKWILVHSMTLIVFLLFLATGEFLFQVRRKRNTLYLQLMNHFSNSLQGKLEKEYLHPEEYAAYKQSYFDQTSPVEAVKYLKEQKENAKKANAIPSQTDKSFHNQEEIAQGQKLSFDVISQLDGQDRLENLVHLENTKNPPSSDSSIAPDMQELINSLLEESKISHDLEEKKKQLTTAATSEKMRLVEDIIKEYM